MDTVDSIRAGFNGGCGMAAGESGNRRDDA